MKHNNASGIGTSDAFKHVVVCQVCPRSSALSQTSRMKACKQPPDDQSRFRAMSNRRQTGRKLPLSRLATDSSSVIWQLDVPPTFELLFQAHGCPLCIFRIWCREPSNCLHLCVEWGKKKASASGSPRPAAFYHECTTAWATLIWGSSDDEWWLVLLLAHLPDHLRALPNSDRGNLICRPGTCLTIGMQPLFLAHAP